MFYKLKLNLKNIRNNKYETKEIRRFSDLTKEEKDEYVANIKKRPKLSYLSKRKESTIREVMDFYDPIINENEDGTNLHSFIVRILRAKKEEDVAYDVHLIQLISLTIITPINRSYSMRDYIRRELLDETSKIEAVFAKFQDKTSIHSKFSIL